MDWLSIALLIYGVIATIAGARLATLYQWGITADRFDLIVGWLTFLGFLSILGVNAVIPAKRAK